MAKGFLLVFSITSRRSLDEARVLREKILRCKDAEKVAMVLVGNKCDLKNERQVEHSDGLDLAKQWGCPFYETSAKLQLNNESCFHELVREIRKFDKDSNDDSTKKKHKPFRFGDCVIL